MVLLRRRCCSLHLRTSSRGMPRSRYCTQRAAVVVVNVIDELKWCSGSWLRSKSEVVDETAQIGCLHSDFTAMTACFGLHDGYHESCFPADRLFENQLR